MPLDRFQSIDPALLDIGPDDRVIDLGCGTGRHVLELAKTPSTVFGADISRHDLRVGRYLLEIMRRDGDVNASVHWMQTAGERLPFVDGAFDRVICTETLEHVDDDAVLARELVRVLKPGGILCVSVPDEFSEKIFWKLSKNYRTHAGGHVRIYRRPQIVQLLRNAGLEPYAVRYRHSLETAYWLSHVAFWSDWGKQGPITSVFRRVLDSQQTRKSRIISALDDIGNRVLPKSIVVYSRKPLPQPGVTDEGLPMPPVTVADDTPHEFGTPEHLAREHTPPEPDARELDARELDARELDAREFALADSEAEAEAAYAEAAYREALAAAGEDVAGSEPEPEPEPEDDRSSIEVRAIPAPFAIEPQAEEPSREPKRQPGAPPPSLSDELRRALMLEGDVRKRRLIEILQSCRFAMMREVQDLSGEQASTPWTADGRTMKEIIGHITGWERWTIAALDEVAAGSAEPAIMSLAGYPIGIARYASIDAFNGARMAESRERPWADILDESAEVFAALLDAIERTPAEAMRQTAPFYWPDIGGTVPCGVYLLMVAAHHYQEEHLPEVLRRAPSR